MYVFKHNKKQQKHIFFCIKFTDLPLFKTRFTNNDNMEINFNFLMVDG